MVRDELATLIERLLAEHGGEIEAVAQMMKPCEYCRTQHHQESIIRELTSQELTP